MSDDDRELQGKGRAEVVDIAIRDPMWWGYLLILEHLAQMLRRFQHWAEWCPCHGDLILELDNIEFEDEKIKAEIAARWRSCPLRGCRAPCLAAGDFFKLVDDLGRITAANILLGLPPDFSDAEKQRLLTEFNLGRGHIQFYMQLKLHHWTQPPWVVYKLAHFSESVATRALGECLDATDEPHPLIRALLQEPLYSELMLWVDGSHRVGDLENLCMLLTSLRFAWTAERWVEVSGVNRVSSSWDKQSR